MGILARLLPGGSSLSNMAQLDIGQIIERAEKLKVDAEKEESDEAAEIYAVVVSLYEELAKRDFSFVDEFFETLSVMASLFPKDEQERHINRGFFSIYNFYRGKAVNQNGELDHIIKLSSLRMKCLTELEQYEAALHAFSFDRNLRLQFPIERRHEELLFYINLLKVKYFSLNRLGRTDELMEVVDELVLESEKLFNHDEVVGKITSPYYHYLIDALAYKEAGSLYKMSKQQEELQSFWSRLQDIAKKLRNPERRKPVIGNALTGQSLKKDEFQEVVDTIISVSYEAGKAENGLGVANSFNTQPEQSRIHAKIKADQKALAFAPYIDEIKKGGINTLQGIADALNEAKRFPKPGKIWSPTTVRALQERIEQISKGGVTQPKLDLHTERLMPLVKEIQSLGITTLQGIANALNERNALTVNDNPWTAGAVKVLIQRIDRHKGMEHIER